MKAGGAETAHAGIHAGACGIGEKPLWEYVPCFRPEEGVIAISST